jgi:opacity protein-like surface antigen
LCVKGYGQQELYFAPGIGINYSTTHLDKLQNSFDTYLTNLTTIFPTDPSQAVDNWSSVSLRPTYSFQFGLRSNKFTTGMAYFYNDVTQTRSVMQQSGFGRKFVWNEKRHEIVVDLGYGTEYLDVFGSVGSNFNYFKLSSYQIYPSGALSINSEYFYNGNFRQFDAGMTYGLGVRIKPIKFLAIELRYILSRDNLIGESTEGGGQPALSDDSFARIPGTSQYPQDYTQPISLDNEIVADFKRSAFICSILFYLKYSPDA